MFTFIKNLFKSKPLEEVLDSEPVRITPTLELVAPVVEEDTPAALIPQPAWPFPTEEKPVATQEVKKTLPKKNNNYKKKNSAVKKPTAVQKPTNIPAPTDPLAPNAPQKRTKKQAVRPKKK
jgi:hypothetical protein